MLGKLKTINGIAPTKNYEAKYQFISISNLFVESWGSLIE